MAISIAILKGRNELSVHFGNWTSKEEAQNYLWAGGDEQVIALEKYSGLNDGNSPNAKILEAIMLSTNTNGLGHDLEALNYETHKKYKIWYNNKQRPLGRCLFIKNGFIHP